MSKMRTMTHHGRGKGNGGKAYGTQHNDRNFDTEQATNIAPELADQNRYWHLYQDMPAEPAAPAEPEKKEAGTKTAVLYCRMDWKIQGMIDEIQGTDYAAQDKARYFARKRAAEQQGQAKEPKQPETFEEAELLFYEQHFSGQLAAVNANYEKNGHPERCKDMAAWKESRRNAPAESIFQIGDKHNTGVHADADTLWECFQEYAAMEQAWNEEHGNPFTVLTVALHADEPECPAHIHVRRAWHYQEGEQLFLGQEKALAQAGIELPHPDKKEGRYNNRKMVYDAMMREKWLDILESRGIQVEREPAPGSKKKPSKDKEQYIRTKYAEMEQGAAAAKAAAQEAEKEADFQHQLAETEAARAAENRQAADQLQAQLVTLQQEAGAALQTVKAAESRASDLDAAYQEQKALYDELRQLNKSLGIPELNQSLREMEGVMEEVEQLPKGLAGNRKVSPGLFDRMLSVLKGVWNLVSNLVHQLQDAWRQLDYYQPFEQKCREAEASRDKWKEQYFVAATERSNLDGQNKALQGEVARQRRFMSQVKLPDGRSIMDAYKAQEAAEAAKERQRNRGRGIER